MGHITTRSDDERALAWLVAVSKGRSSYKVADEYGVSSGYVRGTIGRIMRADLAESGEDRRSVMAGYPWSRL